MKVKTASERSHLIGRRNVRLCIYNKTEENRELILRKASRERQLILLNGIGITNTLAWNVKQFLTQRKNRNLIAKNIRIKSGDESTKYIIPKPEIPIITKKKFKSKNLYLINTFNPNRADEKIRLLLNGKSLAKPRQRTLSTIRHKAIAENIIHSEFRSRNIRANAKTLSMPKVTLKTRNKLSITLFNARPKL